MSDLQRALRFASLEETVVRVLIHHLTLRTMSVHAFLLVLICTSALLDLSLTLAEDFVVDRLCNISR